MVQLSPDQKRIKELYGGPKGIEVYRLRDINERHELWMYDNLFPSQRFLFIDGELVPHDQSSDSKEPIRMKESNPLLTLIPIAAVVCGFMIGAGM